MTIRKDGQAVLRLGSFNGSDTYVYPVILRHLPSGEWRISDVVIEGFSRRATFVSRVACLRRAHNQRQADRCPGAGSYG